MGDNNQVKLNYNSSSNVQEYNYTWTIPKYYIKHKYSEKLTLRDDIECTIMLVPRNEEFKDSRAQFIRSYFKLFFTKLPANRRIWFNFEVKSHYKRRPVSSTDFRRALMNVEGFQGKRNQINSFTCRSYLDNDSALKLDIQLLLDESSSNTFNLKDENSKLLQDMTMLYKEPKFTDMKLICANNYEIPVNKVILASRSPIFAKILTDDIDSYAIGDEFSKEVVTEFIRYIYTDKVSITEFKAYAVDLLEMAEKYEVTELAKICKQELVDGCKDELDEIFKKWKNLTCQNIARLENFAEISRCINNLYQATKNID